MASAGRTRLPPSFNRLAWSNLAAQSAEQIAVAAAPIVTVLALGGGAGETGLIQTAQTLPFLLFAIPAGMLADRMSRRSVMAYAEALRVVSLIAILALAELSLLTWPLLALLGLIGACGTVAYSVAAPSLVPALVPSQALASANSRIELARTLAFAAGPALGGALVGWSGAAPAFGLAAALSACAVVLLAGLDEPPRAPLPPRHPLADIREGARFVFRHRLLRPVFVTQFVFNTAFFILLAVFVPYAIRSLDLSASAVGVILGTFGVGMVVGALVAGRIIRLLPFGIVVAIGPVAGLAAALVMVLTISIPSALLAGLSFFLLGVGPIVWVIGTTTLRQTVTPPDLLGRVSAINIMAYGARPIGAGIGAFIGGAYGMDLCLVAAAIGFLAQAAVILLSPVVRLAHLPEMLNYPTSA
jgi:predicted MFS family arabinose efflux permease